MGKKWGRAAAILARRPTETSAGEGFACGDVFRGFDRDDIYRTACSEQGLYSSHDAAREAAYSRY